MTKYVIDDKYAIGRCPIIIDVLFKYQEKKK